jgi:nicotinate-nucleotide pyrophosphorylase (carboxylating)
VKEAASAGADVIVIGGVNAEELKRLVAVARTVSESVAIECSGAITPANVREYAEAGAQLIRVEALTNAAPAMKISFNVQSY